MIKSRALRRSTFTLTRVYCRGYNRAVTAVAQCPEGTYSGWRALLTRREASRYLRDSGYRVETAWDGSLAGLRIVDEDDWGPEWERHSIPRTAIGLYAVCAEDHWAPRPQGERRGWRRPGDARPRKRIRTRRVWHWEPTGPGAPDAWVTARLSR